MADDLKVRFPKPCDERWETMEPAGCGRLCARCDKMIHDLSKLDIGEAEALLRRDPQTCVRAAVDANGVVALRPRPGRVARRMVIAVAAAAGLVTAAAPAAAKRERPAGAITGTVEQKTFPVRVTATDAEGRMYRTHVSDKGRYRLKHLPPGAYKLAFTPSCGEAWTVENVIVGSGETVVPQKSDESACIVVGRLEIERTAADRTGSG